MAEAVRPAMRRRSSVANGERIVDAGLAELIERGPDSFTLRDVAARVGLSHAAVYSRYDDRDDLLADLWMRRSRADFQRLLDTVGDATSRPESLGMPGHVVSEPRVRAALELCVASRRCGALADVVPASVAAMCADAGLIADGVIVDTIGMGYLILQVGTAMVGPLQPHVYGEALTVPVALARGAREWSGPAPTPVTMSFAFAGADEPLDDRLIAAAGTVVARGGVARAAVKRIARVAGCSPSALYGVYSTREALLVDLVARQAIDDDPAGRAMVAVGAVSAPAALIAGWTHPASTTRRRILIEMWTATPHEQPLRAVRHAAVEQSRAEQARSLARRGTDLSMASIVSIGATLTIGACVLAEVLAPVGVDMSTHDWRPFMSSVMRGLLKMAGDAVSGP